VKGKKFSGTVETQDGDLKITAERVSDAKK